MSFGYRFFSGLVGLVLKARPLFERIALKALEDISWRTLEGGGDFRSEVSLFFQVLETWIGLSNGSMTSSASTGG